MNRRLLAPAAAVLALGGFLAACGDDKESKEELIDRMVDSGMTEEQANCVYDELGDDANDFLNQSEDDASDEDVARLTETMTACMGGSVTVPDLGDVSIPDLGEISIPDLDSISIPDVENS